MPSDRQRLHELRTVQWRRVCQRDVVPRAHRCGSSRRMVRRQTIMEYTKLTRKQDEWWAECVWLDGSIQELPHAHFEMVDPLTGEFRRDENSIRPISDMLRFRARLRSGCGC